MRNVAFAIALLGFSPSAIAAQADCSATTTVANQPITLFSASAVNGFMLQNINTTRAIWFSFIGAAKAGAQGSFILPPSQAKAFATSNMITLTFSGASIGTVTLSVVAAAAGHSVSCLRW